MAIETGTLAGQGRWRGAGVIQCWRRWIGTALNFAFEDGFRIFIGGDESARFGDVAAQGPGLVRSMKRVLGERVWVRK